MRNATSVLSNSPTLWTVACQTPLSMGFSRQEYCSELPCPPQGYLPDPESRPRPRPIFPNLSPVSPVLQAESLLLSHWQSPSYSPWGHKRVGHDLAKQQQQH